MLLLLLQDDARVYALLAELFDGGKAPAGAAVAWAEFAPDAAAEVFRYQNTAGFCCLACRGA